MKAICLQENLSKGIQIVKQSSGRNTTLPILNNILFEISNGEITLYTTNLDIGIKTVIRGKIETEGKLTIPQDKILNYVKNLPHEQVTIEAKENSLTVECNQQYFASFVTMAADDFPMFPTLESKTSLKFSMAIFKQALKRCFTALPKNDFRPELAGVLLKRLANNFFLVGTDGFRLVENTLIPEELPSGEDFQVIIPTKTVSELIRIFEMTDDDVVEIVISENQIFLVTASVKIISRLIDKDFPAYEGLIPKDYEKIYKVSRPELIQAIKLSSVFSTDKVFDVDMSFGTDGFVTVGSKNSEVGTSSSKIAVDNINAPKDSKFDIAFNFNYTLDGLNLLASDNIFVKINDADSPVIFADEEETNFFYLIMPIRG
jgi:DNA polymerase-3 subunit beta